MSDAEAQVVYCLKIRRLLPENIKTGRQAEANAFPFNNMAFNL